MYEQEILQRLTGKCDIFFENSLISKELIIQKYADFFTRLISLEKHSSSVALHTGSVCFSVMSFVIAALACIVMDQTNPDRIIDSLIIDDMVIFKNERFRWQGIERMNGVLSMKLKQDGKGKNGPTIGWYPLEENKVLIKPYHGSSEVTDGRGLRKKTSDRADFISYITDKSKSEIPAITSLSVIIVSNRKLFDRLQKSIRIEYDGKSINILDIIPASYYTDVDESYQYGSNPSKSEPVLKVAGKMSVARDLILNKHGNKSIGLIVIGSEIISKSPSELEDLLVRKSLRFVHLSMDIDSEIADKYIGDEISSVFACTKEFLLKYSKSIVETNPITLELYKQVENIVNNEVTEEIVKGGCACNIYQEIKNSLFVIKRSDWDEDKNRNFIISAYSLLKLLVTAVFSMETLEFAIENKELHHGVISPSSKINELWEASEESGSLELHCVNSQI